MLSSGKDVLPAIRSEEAGLEPIPLILRQLTATGIREVLCVRGRLQLQNAVDGNDEIDEFIHGRVARFRAE